MGFCDVAQFRAKQGEYRLLQMLLVTWKQASLLIPSGKARSETVESAAAGRTKPTRYDAALSAPALLAAESASDGTPPTAR